MYLLLCLSHLLLSGHYITSNEDVTFGAVYKDVDVIGKNKKHRDNIKLNVTTKWLVSVLCRRSGLVLENLTGS